MPVLNDRKIKSLYKARQKNCSHYRKIMKTSDVGLLFWNKKKTKIYFSGYFLNKMKCLFKSIKGPYKEMSSSSAFSH